MVTPDDQHRVRRPDRSRQDNARAKASGRSRLRLRFGHGHLVRDPASLPGRAPVVQPGPMRSAPPAKTALWTPSWNRGWWTSPGPSDRVVFDSWALAWICPVPVLRIWIESDLPSRTRKCLVSLGDEPRPLAECEGVLRAKDDYNRAMFLRRHGFDLFTDRERYHAVLCNSHLIPSATRQESTARHREVRPRRTRRSAGHHERRRGRHGGTASQDLSRSIAASGIPAGVA